MSKSHENVAFQGGGEILIRERGSATGFRTFGNADSFNFAINEEKKTQRDYRDEAGGNAAFSSKITDVTANINGLSFQADTLAIALRAIVTLVPVTAVVDEVLELHEDASTPLKNVPDMDKAFTLTAEPTAGNFETLVPGTDYVVKRGVIKMINYTEAAAGVPAKVSYSTRKSYEINAMAAGAKEYEIFFNGFNSASDGSKPVTVRVHRVKFSPAQALEWISDDYGSLAQSFEVLKDESIIQADKSQYFKIQMVQD